MKIQRKPLAALTGTAALVAGVALWPSAAGAEPDRKKSNSGGKTLEIAFVAERLDETLIDNGTPGLSLGDKAVYTNSSTSEYGVATEYGECTAHQVTVTTTMWNCVVTSVGDSGTLTSQGPLELDNTTGEIVGGEGVWAITGGTGEFSRARGESRFTSPNDGSAVVATGTARIHLR